MSAAIKIKPFVLADWEVAAQASLDPEYVLLYLPSALFTHLLTRLFRGGWWELVTAADYRAGIPAGDGWLLDAPQNTPVERLAGWVQQRVGFPVALQPDTERITPAGARSRTYTVPMYWVRRNT
jgi:hypothetical protein